MGSHRCGDGGIVIGLESVADLLAGIEESLDAGDWDALGESQPAHPDVTPEDEQELRRLIVETDRLQRLISSYMDRVSTELDQAPQMRRAATAYTRAAGTG